jgi:hypothetical protein
MLTTHDASTSLSRDGPDFRTIFSWLCPFQQCWVSRMRLAQGGRVAWSALLAACGAVCMLSLSGIFGDVEAPAFLTQKLSYGVRSALNCCCDNTELAAVHSRGSPQCACVSACLTGPASWPRAQAPESFGTETQQRTPPRSVNSMGDALPPVAAEIEPPGYYKTRGDLDGSLVTTRSGVVYNDHTLGAGGASSSPAEPAEGPEVGVGAPLEVDGTAVSKKLGPTYGVHAMDKDDGWVAPYGNFKDLQLGDEPDANSEELNILQKGIQNFHDRAREQEERVQGKVWREHQRVEKLTSETERLNTWLQELQYRWDHGPYPVHGPPGHEGRRGEAGPAGANGRTGHRGPAGHAGAPGLTEVVEEIQRRHDGPGMLKQIVARDIAGAEKKSAVYEKLQAMRRRLAELSSANQRLLAKLRSSSRMGPLWHTHVPADDESSRKRGARGRVAGSKD